MKMYRAIGLAVVAILFHGGVTEAGQQTIHERSAAVGVGLPYGGGGLNLEARLTPLAAIMGGIGVMGEHTGYNAGIRLYTAQPEWTADFRATLLYGTNAMYEKEGRGDKTLESGFSAGVGVRWRFSGNWLLDVDLIYAVLDEPAGYELSGAPISIAAGVGYRF